MLSDMQRMVHGMSVHLCDNGHHTTQHDYTIMIIATGSQSTNAYVHSDHAGCCDDIIDGSVVQAQLRIVLYVNNVYTACHDLGTTCSRIWIHATLMLA